MHRGFCTIVLHLDGFCFFFYLGCNFYIVSFLAENFKFYCRMNNHGKGRPAAGSIASAFVLA